MHNIQPNRCSGFSAPTPVIINRISKQIQYFSKILIFQADNFTEIPITYDNIEYFSLFNSHQNPITSISKQIQYYCKLLYYQAKNTTKHSIIQENIVLATISIHNNSQWYRDIFPFFCPLYFLITLKLPEFV